MPATSVDLFATLLATAGLDAPPNDGVDLRPTLRGEPQSRGPLFWHYPHYGNQGGAPGSAIRDGDWKLIEWAEGERVELFDLRADPGEQTDLAAKEPARSKDLRGRLAAWREDVGARAATAR